MKTKIKLLALFALSVFVSNAQDAWEPQTHFTGYLNAMIEYADIDALKDHKTGIGLAEAGFLASYKPLEKLEIKGTLVYTHHVQNIQNLLVEAYGTYSFNDMLKVGGGKFLTPLSPVNTYFYAPLNISATLPMLVSHHVLVPQSIAGFQVAGEFGNDYKLKYNFTYGTYENLGHPKNGILGVLGHEEVVPLSVPDFEPEYLLGGSARLEGSYKGIVTLGLNYFDGTESTLLSAHPNTGVLIEYDASKYSFGVDAHLAIGGLKINAEYWLGEQTTNDAVDLVDWSTGTPYQEVVTAEYSAYYAEVMYTQGMFTPYVRYDFIQDVITPVLDAPTDALSLGLAVRPIYETLFKLEYRKVNIDYTGVGQDGIDGVIPANDFQTSYNHFLFSTVISF
jgi:hypothetical protein